MMLHAERLLAFARELQRASNYAEILETCRVEASEALGLPHVWLFVGDREPPDEVRLIDSASTQHDAIATAAPVLQIRGDAMLEEIATSDHPIVVLDARTDPRVDKKIVAELGNRTIINIPLRLLDKPFGAFGLGTFGDEGTVDLTPEQLEYLVAMASQLSVAVSRIRLLAERARAEEERLSLERRIAQMQKLESLGMLAGGIAHDFNNLLTIILTGASLAQMLPPGERGDAGLDAVIEAARRGHDLTKQLLAMSRSQPKELTTYDLAARLKQLLAMARRLIPESIQIEVSTVMNLPAIEADPSQIDQVFLNLCINARDAMPGGGRLVIRIEEAHINDSFVRTHPWAKPGTYVLTTVTDTGTGMSPEIVARIFEPFFTTKKDQGGTGLGLAVTHGIVRNHGGLLHCYSEAGVGTTFKVYLPIHAPSAVEPRRDDESPVQGGTERVLVAEDDPGVRVLIGSILEGAGYTVALVENGADACDRACLQRFDLVILDAVMPRMSGPEALLRIRALLPEARFLLSSGYPAELHTLQEPAVTILSKPYDPDALLRAVRRALDKPPQKA